MTDQNKQTPLEAANLAVSILDFEKQYVSQGQLIRTAVKTYLDAQDVEELAIFIGQEINQPDQPQLAQAILNHLKAGLHDTRN